MSKDTPDPFEEMFDEILYDLQLTCHNCEHPKCISLENRSRRTIKQYILKEIIGDDEKGCGRHEQPTSVCSSGLCLVATAINETKAHQRAKLGVKEQTNE